MVREGEGKKKNYTRKAEQMALALYHNRNYAKSHFGFEGTRRESSRFMLLTFLSWKISISG